MQLHVISLQHPKTLLISDTDAIASATAGTGTDAGTLIHGRYLVRLKSG